MNPKGSKYIMTTAPIEKYILYTSNFQLRPFIISDLEIFWHWVRHSNAMDYELDIDSAKRMLDRFIHSYERLGFSKFAVFFKENDEFLGYCGFELLHDPEGLRNPLPKTYFNQIMQSRASTYYPHSSYDLELGYRIHEKHWGKGYATEIADGICQWGFTNINTNRILAMTEPSNISSQKVLEKIGFSFAQSLHTQAYGKENLYLKHHNKYGSLKL